MKKSAEIKEQDDFIENSGKNTFQTYVEAQKNCNKKKSKVEFNKKENIFYCEDFELNNQSPQKKCSPVSGCIVKKKNARGTNSDKTYGI